MRFQKNACAIEAGSGSGGSNGGNSFQKNACAIEATPDCAIADDASFQKNACAIEASRSDTWSRRSKSFQKNACAIEAPRAYPKIVGDRGFRRTLVRLKPLALAAEPKVLGGFRRTLVRLKPDRVDTQGDYIRAFQKNACAIEAGCREHDEHTRPVSEERLCD